MGTEIDDPDKFKPGSFGCHEALHMTSFLAVAVDTELKSHPSIKSNPEWKKLANQAYRALANLYDAIGDAHLDNSKG